MGLIKSIIALIIVVSECSGAEPNSGVANVTYGDLMIEDIANVLGGKNQMQIASGFDVTNPYLNTFNYSLQFLRELGPLFALGFEASTYTSRRSRYNERLTQELAVQGVRANDDRPQAAAFAIGQLRLLQGRVNLLGYSALPFQFNLKAGGGFIWHHESPRTSAATWGFSPELYPTKDWGLSLRYDQDIEQIFSGGDTAIYRQRISVGLNYIF